MSDKPVLKTERIDPNLAVKYLSTVDVNRASVKHHIDRLAADMKSGRWIFTGAPISFNNDGHLIDGAHRLLALIKSGVTLDFIVIRGLSSDAQSAMDLGRSRNLRDHLSMAGEHYSSNLAAAINFLRRYRKYQDFWQHDVVPSALALVEVLAKNPTLRSFVNAYSHPRPQLPVSSAILGVLHFLMSELDSDLAEEFMNELVKGENLRAGDPTYALRQWVIRQRSSGRKFSFTPDFGHFSIRCWNSWLRDEKVYVLRPASAPYVLKKPEGTSNANDESGQAA